MTAAQRWMGKLVRELFAFDEPVSTGSRVFMRVFELCIAAWTLQLAWTWFGTLARIEAVVLPLGLANYVDVSVFFGPLRAALLAGSLTVAIALGFTRRARYAYAVAVLLFHFMYVSRYCLGEISHGSNFVGTGVLGLALATAFFRESEASIGKFTRGFLLFWYGLGYTSAGTCKLVGTGLRWASGDHLALWIGERSIDVMSGTGVFELNALQDVVLRYPVAGTAVLAFGLLAELGGVLVWFRKTRMVALTALIGMHVGIDISMNIYFGHNIYLLVLLAYPWSRAFDAIVHRGSSLRAGPSTA